MKNDLNFVKKVLPDHHTCEPRKDGIHCYSNIGIDENDPEHWKYVFLAFKQHFKDRFQSVYHQTCTDHLKFSIFFKKNCH